MSRQQAVISVKNTIGVPLSDIPVDSTFSEETLGLAKELMPTLGITRHMGSGFTPQHEVARPAANPPTLDATFTGGVFQFGAVASSLALNPVTPASATYNPILGSFGAKSQPWMMRGRFFLNVTDFTAATSCVFLSLEDTGVGGGAANHKIQFLSLGTTSTRQTYIRVQGATGPADVSTGPDGLLGGVNGIPINQWFTLWLAFDLVNVRWAVNDRFNALNKLDAIPGQLDSMPSDVASVVCSSTDTTVSTNFKIDDLSIAYCATQENK